MSDSKNERVVPESTDELGRDMAVAAWLQRLDPAEADPHYWVRFQSRVMRSAAPELARRRLLSQLTMGDVMTSWARTVIPTAVLAAALAGLLLFQGRADPAPAPVGIEELLLAGVEGTTIPGTLEGDEVTYAVSFASEGF